MARCERHLSVWFMSATSFGSLSGYHIHICIRTPFQVMAFIVRRQSVSNNAQRVAMAVHHIRRSIGSALQQQRRVKMTKTDESTDNSARNDSCNLASRCMMSEAIGAARSAGVEEKEELGGGATNEPNEAGSADLPFQPFCKPRHPHRYDLPSELLVYGEKGKHLMWDHRINVGW